jgi:hypothetical protein
VSSSQIEPIDSPIYEESTVINEQLQLSKILTRAHRREIGQPPIEFTIPERGRYSRKDKDIELNLISRPNPLAQIANILRGSNDPNNYLNNFPTRLGSGKSMYPPKSPHHTLVGPQPPSCWKH